MTKLSCNNIKTADPRCKLTDVPFKLCQDVCHDHSALQSPVCDGVVFKQGKQVLALLHGQTSDQLLHNLQEHQMNTA